MTSSETNPSSDLPVDSSLDPVAKGEGELIEEASGREGGQERIAEDESPRSEPLLPPSDFIFVVCQNGAESATKTEILNIIRI